MMDKGKSKKIIFKIIGVLLILGVLLLWYFLGTVGLVILVYNYQLNNEIAPFLILPIGFIIGIIVFRIGLRLLLKKQ